MIDAAATSVSLSPRLGPFSRMPRVLRRPAAAMRNPVVLRLVAFVALASFAAIHWVALLAHPPAARVALAIVVAVVCAVAVASLAAMRLPRLVAVPLVAIVAALTVATGALAVGLPIRLLAPAHWGELGAGLNSGLSELGNADLPFRGGGWPRQAVLLGLPLLLGLAAALAFWPSRRGAMAPRIPALLILVAVYGVGATVTPPGALVLHGFILLVLVAAWLWLPRLAGRDALIGAALVLAAGTLALPVASGLDRGGPWLDYRNWEWAWYRVGGGEAFDWNHSYGPLDWPRTGRALLRVRSDEPHYWRAAVLDQFDGTRWDQSGQSVGGGSVEFPRSTSGFSISPQTVRLNPNWIHEVEFEVQGLSSRLVVGVGTALSVDGVGGITRTGGALTLASDQSLSDGDSYTVRAYIPDPSPTQMRNAPTDYPKALAPYGTLAIPFAEHDRDVIPPRQRPGLTSAVTTVEVSVPWWGRTGPTRRRVAKGLGASPYGDVYRLTHRITRNAPTPYAAVNAVQRYLKNNYTYSETPRARRFPLRSFLFEQRAGYCQQFSGAMALMLRMAGIPSRVATGFAPGRPSDDGSYLVRDFDAHSWVEVYFNGIGWVPFDPTPAAAPNQASTNGLGLFQGSSGGEGKVVEKDGLAAGPGRSAQKDENGASPNRSSSSLVPLDVLGIAAGFATVAGIALAWGSRRRRRARLPADPMEARLRELEDALRRVRSWRPGGMTLLELEDRLRRLVGPRAAAYAARLRDARYAAGTPAPPTVAERRAMRRELSYGFGLRGRVRAYLAIPPGGPAAPSATRAWRAARPTSPRGRPRAPGARA